MDTFDICSMVKSTSPSSGGIHCQYIKVTDTVGIKIVRATCAMGADSMYALHEAVHKAGLGPRVWGFTKVDSERYAFFTEHCSVFHEDADKYTKSEIKAAYKDIFERAADATIHLFDMHMGNVGMLNGKAVLIDGGSAGCYWDSDINMFRTVDYYTGQPIGGKHFDSEYQYQCWLNRNFLDYYTCKSEPECV